jgi:hypothetical protein
MPSASADTTVSAESFTNINKRRDQHERVFGTHRVKNTWRFSLSHATPHSETAATLWADIGARTLELLTRAQREGLIDPDTDLE